VALREDAAAPVCGRGAAMLLSSEEVVHRIEKLELACG